MSVIVNDFLKSTVTIQDVAGSIASLNKTLVHTDETPLVPLTGRVKEYLSDTEVGVDWGITSKIYWASLPHFAQKTHNQFLKIGREIPKGATQSSNDITALAGIATFSDVAHGRSPGDEVTVSGADSAGLNGLKKIIDVPTADTFTYDAPGVGDGADANNGSIEYHVGDATMTTALDVIFAEDKDWIQLHSIKKSKADILEIAAWASGKNIIYGTSSEDADVKVKGVGNVLESLEALNYGNTYYIWRHQAGVDAAGVAIEVSPTIGSNDINVLSAVATLINPTTPRKHGRNIGDKVTISGADDALLNVLQTITAIPSESSFSFAAVGVGDGPDANNGAINYKHTNSEIATVTKANHGLRVDDPLTPSGATPADLNGNKTVLFVVNANIFTYAAEGVVDGAATGTINYFARYKFFEVAISGFMLSKDIGTVSWDANGGFGPVQGQIATPQSLLSEIELVNIIGINGQGGQSGNVYVSRFSDVFTKGWMVTQRFIENETVRIWLEQRLAEAIMRVTAANPGKKPYTNNGLNKYFNAMQNPINEQLDRTGLLPLFDAEMNDIIDAQVGANDLFLRLAGYIFIYQDMDTIAAEDRLAGNVPSPKIFVRIGQAIHRIEIEVIASV